MSEDFEDFGFTLVSEDELDNSQEPMSRLDRLYAAIQPLLNNLRANPEKEYIKWPDRAAKVDQFAAKLDAIYHGTDEES